MLLQLGLLVASLSAQGAPLRCPGGGSPADLPAEGLRVVSSFHTRDVPPAVAKAYGDRLATGLGRNGVTVAPGIAEPGPNDSARSKACPGTAGAATASPPEPGSGIDGLLEVELAQSAAGATVELSYLPAGVGPDAQQTVHRRWQLPSMVEALDQTEAHAAAFASDLAASLHRTLPRRASLRPWSIAPGAAAVLAGALGGGLWFSAEGSARSLQTSEGAQLSLPIDAFRLAQGARAQQATGVALVAVGSALAAAAAVMFVAGGDPPSPGLAPAVEVARPGSPGLSGGTR